VTNILVDFTTHAPALARLKNHANLRFDVIDNPVDEGPRPLPAERIRDAEILFCTYPPTNVADMRALKFVQIASSGYTQLFNIGLVERGIRAANAAGVFDIAIAEWNVAMIVNLKRDLRGMIRNQEAGIWDRDARFQKESRGSVVGIWGYGGIGRQTARLCKSLGFVVHVMTRSGAKPRLDKYAVSGTGDPEGALPDRQFVAGQEKEFLGGLDFLVLSMPLTNVTRGLVGEAELRALPPTAYVLNPARGPLIQEEALLRALREQWIAGAALDAHYYYPMPADHPLWRFPNVILTPHISGSSSMPYFAERVWDIFAQNVERWTHEKPLLNELTPAQLRGE
jgi:phosphoglycerate dehydrogenase-like enzyme